MAGQTLSELRSLLASAGLAPRRRFGQNFLIDLNLMRKLVALGDPRAGDVILEVGCGTGSLTELLLEKGARVVGVEIDRGLAGVLRDRLGAEPRFTLIQGDALAGKHRINPLVSQVLSEQTPEPGGGYKLVANLPYQIATPLLVDLLHAEPAFERLACTIQKEVGRRLSAPVDTPAYGPVSVIAQTLAEIELRAIVPPTAFWPRPAVESVMLLLRPRPREQVGVSDVPGFIAFLHRAFAQRRKMLRKIFADRPPLELAAAFERAGVNSADRPQDVSPQQWRVLFARLCSGPGR